MLYIYIGYHILQENVHMTLTRYTCVHCRVDRDLVAIVNHMDPQFDIYIYIYAQYILL